MKYLHLKKMHQTIILILILLSINLITIQCKSAHSSLKKENSKMINNLDSLKIDLSISYRRDAGSYKYYNKLSSQDTINYKIPADTILGRVRVFKTTVNEKASLGNYKKSRIKEIKLEFKKKDKVLSIEHEKYFRSVNVSTLWNGKKSKRPKLLSEADQVVIILITETNNKTINSKYIVKL